MREMIKECHDLGELTNEFASAALKMAWVVIDKNWRLPDLIRDDAKSRFSEKIVKFWKKIDPEKNPNAYIRSMASTALLDAQRRANSQRMRIEGLTEEVESDKEFYENKMMDFALVTSQESLFELLEVGFVWQLSREQIALVREEVTRRDKAGIPQIKIAQALGVNRMTVSRWVKGYQKYGKKFFKMDKRRSIGK